MTYMIREDDLNRQRLLARIFNHESRTHIRAAGPKLDGHWLDVGTGLGETAKMLAAIQTVSGTLIGIDMDRALIEVARSHDYQTHDVTFREADVYQLPFEADSFDFVHTRFLLMHLAEPVKALQEMRRVSKPDGIVLAMEPSFESFRTHPETDCYRKLKSLLNHLLPDSRIGTKLAEHFHSAGFTHPHQETGRLSDVRNREFARFISMTFGAMKDELLRRTSLTDARFQTHLNEFLLVQNDTKIMVNVPVNYAVWANAS